MRRHAEPSTNCTAAFNATAHKTLAPGRKTQALQSVQTDAFDTSLEYLIGTALVPEQPGAEPRYESQWSLEPTAEKKAFEQFIATVMDRWKRYPDLHIYHYASYEPSAVKRLAGRHGTCAEEVDRLLRAGVFVDLYRILRQALRASVESYSIKQVEALYAFKRSISPRHSVAALQTFEIVLTLGT